jgi:hypothetical protein
MQNFKRTEIDTHYGPFCWARIVPMKLPKGTPYYAQIIADATRPGYAVCALECAN